jgi:O-antigen ligase
VSVRRSLAGEGFPWLLAGLVCALALLTPFLAYAGNGSLVVALAPLLAIGLLVVLWRIPLRIPVLVLVFAGLVLENPGDGFACGLYSSPLAPLGALLLAHWNTILGFKPLVFSGFDLALVVLFVIALYRRASGSRIDGPEFVESASPLRFFAGVTVAAAFILELWGAVHGGMDFSNSLWQVQHVAYLPILFLLFDLAFRGPRDFPAIAKVVVAAALVRAAVAWGIRHFVRPNSYEAMPHATTHTDSMLFALALCLCIVLLVEFHDRKRIKMSVFVVPVLVLGMIANNRRLVWVEVALALLVLIALVPRRGRFVRAVMRVALVGIPLFFVYLTAGWDSQSGRLFSAARMVRSVIDSKTDASSEWRDWENFNLVFTLKQNPLLGSGYGHPFLEAIPLPKVNYDQEYFLPHNSVLGLWAYGGVVGFTLLWTLIVVAALFAVRSYKLATLREDRVAAMLALMMMVIFLAHCYGDLGLGTWHANLLTGLALVVAGKLALTTGAWPALAQRRTAEYRADLG